MRIIAGTFKGRRLAAPRGPTIRPTSDKLRETLFNVLAPRMEGARVLDGFAGTGANGLEALSRGAARVIFIERDREALALIEENVRRCGVETGYAIMRGAFDGVLRALALEVRFDVILLDPPYEDTDHAAVVTAAATRLETDGRLVLEHARRLPAPERAGNLVRVREVVSGDSALAFYDRA